MLFDGEGQSGYVRNGVMMKTTQGTKEAVKILAAALGNFSVAAFTLGIFQGDYMGIILGCYSLLLAMVLAWRIEQ